MTYEFFYDRSARVWIGLIKDEAGNQVGDAEIANRRREVIAAIADRLAEVVA
jgi:hypothetical protein